VPKRKIFRLRSAAISSLFLRAGECARKERDVLCGHRNGGISPVTPMSRGTPSVLDTAHPVSRIRSPITIGDTSLANYRNTWRDRRRNADAHRRANDDTQRPCCRGLAIFRSDCTDSSRAAAKTLSIHHIRRSLLIGGTSTSAKQDARLTLFRRS